MTRILISLVLAAFLVREVLEFKRRYLALKQDLARGDSTARLRLYRRALVFEGASALLALLALRFDWKSLTPGSLALGDVPLVHALTGEAGRGMLPGIVGGLVAGTIGLFIAQRRAAKGGTPIGGLAGGLRRLLPDFGALLPVSASERATWLAVAVAAGVCEEIVFRGWLLAVLHDPLGLHGMALIAAAALVFGLAHLYQGPAGTALTGFAALFFIALYVATGSLLVPILLHVAVDARFALLPAPAVPDKTGLDGAFLVTSRASAGFQE